MIGVSGFTAQHTAKLALLAACQTALAGEEVDVSFGLRWPINYPDWVSLEDTRSSIDAASVGARRSQDETITLDFQVGAWRAGGDADSELAASARAFDLLQRIQDHVRRRDITLGGTVMWALPGESASAGATPPDDAGGGRLTIIDATFVCMHRITSL